MPGLFEDRSKDAYNQSIENVKNLGSKASPHDIEMTKRAAKQAGSVGNQAKSALDRIR